MPARVSEKQIEHFTKPHVLTPEERARGRATAAAKRARMAESSLEAMHRIVVERAVDVLTPYLEAMAAGDWRASEAMLDRVYGKPAQRQEIAVTDASTPWQDMTPDERASLRRALIARLASE